MYYGATRFKHQVNTPDGIGQYGPIVHIHDHGYLREDVLNTNRFHIYMVES